MGRALHQVTSLDLAHFLCGVNCWVGSALELTQGSEPLFGLARTPTGRDLKEGTVVCFPEPFLPRGKEYDVNVCKTAQGQAVFPLKQHHYILPNNMAPLPCFLSSQLWFWLCPDRIKDACDFSLSNTCIKGTEHLELEFSTGEMLCKAQGLPSVPMVMSKRELFRELCEMGWEHVFSTFPLPLSLLLTPCDMPHPQPYSHIKTVSPPLPHFPQSSDSGHSSSVLPIEVHFQLYYQESIVLPFLVSQSFNNSIA